MGKFKLISLGALMVASNSAQAAPAGTLWVSSTNGVTLNEMCSQPETNGSHYDPCTSFIIGVGDALTISGKICLNNTASTKQYVAIVKKHLRDNPEKWHNPAVFIVRDALQIPFNCS